MEAFSALSVSTVALFDCENLLDDFFVNSSVTESELVTQDDENGVEPFRMHRKLLRRRHVRKLQKAKERERQRKEEEEKQKELTRERNRKRRAEKSRSLRQMELASTNMRTCKRIRQVETSVASPTQRRGDYHNVRGKSDIINSNTLPYFISSPTSVSEMHRVMLSESKKSPPPAINRNVNTGHYEMMVTQNSVGVVEETFSQHPSFSLPEFSPVRLTKFRKLQL